MKTEEDEAFEELTKRQGDWGMQGSRKHQILRYLEDQERNDVVPNTIAFHSMNTGWVMRITADRRIEVADGIDVTEAARLVLDAMQGMLDVGLEKAVLAEREACKQIIRETPFSNWFQADVIEAIDKRGQALCDLAEDGVCETLDCPNHPLEEKNT